MLESILVLALAGLAPAEASCCASDSRKAAAVECASEEPGCCEEAAATQNWCDRWRSARGSSGRLSGNEPGRLTVGVRGGALRERGSEAWSTTYGLSTRVGITRRLSAGLVADHTRLSGRTSVWSLGLVGRARLAGICFGHLFVEGGPTVVQVQAPAAEAGTAAAPTIATGYTTGLGLSTCAPLGMRAEAAFAVDGVHGRGEVRPGCCSFAAGLRFSLAKSF